MPRTRINKRRRLERVSIRAERREQVDWDRFAYAVLQHAKLVSAQRRGATPGKRGTKP